MTRLAIIGLGRMGTYHTKVAAQNNDVTLAALVSPHTPPADLQALAPHAPSFSSHQAAIELVDAAIIATPTPTHFAIARDFLTAGKHVLVEKPITLSHHEAEKLFTIAQHNNCVLHVGHVERYNPAFTAAQKHLDGTPRMIRAVRSAPFNERVKHDSVIMDLMIHDIDLILSLLQEHPINHYTLGYSHVSEKVDSALTTLQFASGVIASIATHRGAVTAQRTMSIETDTQTLQIDFGTRVTTIIDANGTHTFKPPVDANPLASQLAAFVYAIKQNIYSSGTHDCAVLAETLAAEHASETKIAPLPQTTNTATL